MIAIICVGCLLALGIVHFPLNDTIAGIRSAATRQPGSAAGYSRRPGVRNPSDGRFGGFRPREDIDTSGYGPMLASIPPWDPGASLETIAESFKGPGFKAISELDRSLNLAQDGGAAKDVIASLIYRAMLLNGEREPGRAYEALSQAWTLAQEDDRLARKFLYTIVYFQAIAAMRRGRRFAEITGSAGTGHLQKGEVVPILVEK